MSEESMNRFLESGIQDIIHIGIKLEKLEKALDNNINELQSILNHEIISLYKLENSEIKNLKI